MSIRQNAYKMRKRPTKGEAKLLDRLLDCGVEVESQVVIGRYIADFVVISRMLIIESDGVHHLASVNRRRDSERTDYLKSLGFDVIRVLNAEIDEWNPNVIERYPMVPAKIFRAAMEQSKASWTIAFCSECHRQLIVIKGKLAKHGPRRSCKGEPRPAVS